MTLKEDRREKAAIAVQLLASVPGPIAGKDYVINAEALVVEFGEASLPARLWSAVVGSYTLVANGQVVQEGRRGIVGGLRHGAAEALRFVSHTFYGAYDADGRRIEGSSYLEKGGRFFARTLGGNRK